MPLPEGQHPYLLKQLEKHSQATAQQLVQLLNRQNQLLLERQSLSEEVGRLRLQVRFGATSRDGGGKKSPGKSTSRDHPSENAALVPRRAQVLQSTTAEASPCSKSPARGLVLRAALA
ncbi:hypothetical protein CB1_000818034 [Camelus ferus]|nr:hypothetical protein CB1_000818034 [Camelus ferus]